MCCGIGAASRGVGGDRNGRPRAEYSLSYGLFKILWPNPRITDYNGRFFAADIPVAHLQHHASGT